MKAPPNALRRITVIRGTVACGEGVHEPGAVADHARRLLAACPACNPGVSTSTTSGIPNALQLLDEARALLRAGRVEHAAQIARLVGDHADRAPVDPGERT